MSETVIQVDNLGKRYRLGQNHHDLLSERLSAALRSVRWRRRPASARRARLVSRNNDKDFWALRDVSFAVKKGEVVGVIGRNGAGKSTLLKILSRITGPTEGRVELLGRVGSLLEVGTGFHPELTGRENIFLNGAILGMRMAEIRRKFDEIVEFAEVEEFIDTPVKRYSSGMYVRLAFAVAAHLEPEILLVDEVLAVGDIQFQRKCLGKMGEVAKEGRTVLFVSHNMGAINQICQSCMWLDKGRIREAGSASSIVSSYIKGLDASAGMGEVHFAEDRMKEAQLRRVRLLDVHGRVTQRFDCDKPVIMELLFQVHRRLPGLYGYLLVSRLDGTRVMTSDSLDMPPNLLDNLDIGTYLINVSVPVRTLAHGEYSIYLSFASISGANFSVDCPGTVCSFSLDDLTSRRGNRREGFFSTLLQWEINRITGEAITHEK